MKRGFSAKKEGFDCKKWYEICENKGKTLIIIKTEDDYIFGGFTSVGFTNDKTKWLPNNTNLNYSYIEDPNAFLFSLINERKYPEKFTIKPELSQLAIYYYRANQGPSFGGGNDIHLNCDLRSGFTFFGNTYNLPDGIKPNTNEAKIYLAGSYNQWKVDELETYFI
ncbi:hypothetical protein M0811_00183 [Anaeramoeba ignava]|uniref:TLDc domain-containing protein n=1 Tax=Anaeramoeba ignava TaxID=1746090 RepID=A0A9Q0LT91_ANAIG|nr:hypothetical protein M0811_00183 [Anaeramoeba ignava]